MACTAPRALPQALPAPWPDAATLEARYVKDERRVYPAVYLVLGHTR